jgi:hypothetical protein
MLIKPSYLSRVAMRKLSDPAGFGEDIGLDLKFDLGTDRSYMPIKHISTPIPPCLAPNSLLPRSASPPWWV